MKTGAKVLGENGKGFWVINESHALGITDVEIKVGNDLESLVCGNECRALQLILTVTVGSGSNSNRKIVSAKVSVRLLALGAKHSFGNVRTVKRELYIHLAKAGENGLNGKFRILL